MSGPAADPVQAFRAGAARSDRMFWLDGGGAQPWSGRRSIIGVLAEDDVSLSYDAASRLVTCHRKGRDEDIGSDIFAALAEQLARDAGDPSVHWVGYFGYAARPDLPARIGSGVPDAVWMRVRDPLFIEHDPTQDPPFAAAALDRQEPPADYAAAYDRVQTELRRGNSYEVNLTYRGRVESPRDPLSVYLRLRAVNPAPYAGFLRHRGVSVLSSSPERFATIDRHRMVETKPIKGTTLRGATPHDDRRAMVELSTDPRYRAENLMIVDLLRNDLSKVCEPGTVEVPVLMAVESYPSVHQLVSTVRGRLRDEVPVVEALRALFPAGSMTGAPKLRTMQIIESVEATPRGVYSGAFGWISADGRADLGVVIRTLVATPAPAGWRYEYGTGGGITVRSDLAGEYAETRWKADRLLRALAGD